MEQLHADASLEHAILLIDADARFRDAVAGYLKLQGYLIETASTPLEFTQTPEQSFDLVLLETPLTHRGGLAICRPLISSPIADSTLIRIGTATNGITALELGADDYLAKPCNPRELLARMRAVLRRSSG